MHCVTLDTKSSAGVTSSAALSANLASVKLPIWAVCTLVDIYIVGLLMPACTDAGTANAITPSAAMCLWYDSQPYI